MKFARHAALWQAHGSWSDANNEKMLGILLSTSSSGVMTENRKVKIRRNQVQLRQDQEPLPIPESKVGGDEMKVLVGLRDVELNTYNWVTPRRKCKHTTPDKVTVMAGNHGKVRLLFMWRQTDKYLSWYNDKAAQRVTTTTKTLTLLRLQRRKLLNRLGRTVGRYGTSNQKPNFCHVV